MKFCQHVESERAKCFGEPHFVILFISYFTNVMLLPCRCSVYLGSKTFKYNTSFVQKPIDEWSLHHISRINSNFLENYSENKVTIGDEE